MEEFLPHRHGRLGGLPVLDLVVDVLLVALVLLAGLEVALVLGVLVVAAQVVLVPQPEFGVGKDDFVSPFLAQLVRHRALANVGGSWDACDLRGEVSEAGGYFSVELAVDSGFGLD